MTGGTGMVSTFWDMPTVPAGIVMLPGDSRPAGERFWDAGADHVKAGLAGCCGTPARVASQRDPDADCPSCLALRDGQPALGRREWQLVTPSASLVLLAGLSIPTSGITRSPVLKNVEPILPGGEANLDAPRSHPRVDALGAPERIDAQLCRAPPVVHPEDGEPEWVSLDVDFQNINGRVSPGDPWTIRGWRDAVPVFCTPLSFPTGTRAARGGRQPSHGQLLIDALGLGNSLWLESNGRAISVAYPDFFAIPIGQLLRNTLFYTCCISPPNGRHGIVRTITSRQPNAPLAFDFDLPDGAMFDVTFEVYARPEGPGLDIQLPRAPNAPPEVDVDGVLVGFGAARPSEYTTGGLFHVSQGPLACPVNWAALLGGGNIARMLGAPAAQYLEDGGMEPPSPLSRGGLPSFIATSSLFPAVAVGTQNANAWSTYHPRLRELGHRAMYLGSSNPDDIIRDPQLGPRPGPARLDIMPIGCVTVAADEAGCSEQSPENMHFSRQGLFPGRELRPTCNAFRFMVTFGKLPAAALGIIQRRVDGAEIGLQGQTLIASIVVQYFAESGGSRWLVSAPISRSHAIGQVRVGGRDLSRYFPAVGRCDVAQRTPSLLVGGFASTRTVFPRLVVTVSDIRARYWVNRELSMGRIDEWPHTRLRRVAGPL